MFRVPGIRRSRFLQNLILVILIGLLGSPAIVGAQAQAINVNPTALDFGSIPVNSTSRMQSIEVRNSGSGYLRLYGFDVQAPFVIYAHPSLPLTLLPGETTHVVIYFAPKYSGSQEGRLAVSSNATSGGNTSRLVGRGGSGGQDSGGPVATPSTTRLDFGSQQVNTRSNPRRVILTNSGSATLNISRIDVSGNFSQINNCPATLSPVASCELDVTFAPAASGAHTGSLSFFDNAPDSPQTVALTGIGNGGSGGSESVGLNPTVLDFGGVDIGQTSRFQSVEVRNFGREYLRLTGFSVTTQFSIRSAPPIPLTLLPGETTHVNVSFSPTRTGSLTGILAISTDSSPDPSTVALLGRSGSQGSTQISVSPQTLNFGSRSIGVTSGAQTIAVQNTGSGSVTVSGITATPAHYAIVSAPTIPFTLNAGQSSEVGITFTPTEPGARPGSVTIVSDAPTSPNAVSLSGTGVAASSPLRVTPNSLSFGNLNLGTTSSPQTVTVQNTGSESVSISAITASPEQFALVSAAFPWTLAAGESAAVNVRFAPAAAGTLSGTLTILSNAPSSPDSVSLSGTGVRPGDGGGVDSYGG
ncbi:MAG TPA: choice-of-anchor D domain-containing protein, partial [Candidatus Dormibacteraeota bacterium]|nr:choice-of-anchor D domain-containing protein [Candidatus Dormibacteraeota bacterium]